jgi:tRNA threonylcarbamoyladenosine biosynthesis protein TsaE
MKYTFKSLNKETTFALGKRLAGLLHLGDVITLTGDLGAGKTTLTQGLASGLNVTERVISPTFNIMKCYFKADKPLFHIDAYRLEDANKDIGLEEFIGAEGISVIEWPMYIAEFVPEEVLKISLVHAGGDERIITLEGNNAHYDEVVSILKGEFQ